MKHLINAKMNQLTQSNRSRFNQGFKTSRRKQLGNTLVPVVIGIAITAIATAGFLNQGADISSRNKVSIGANEISTMLYDWNLLRINTAAADIAVADAPAEMNGGANIFGVANNVYANAADAAPTLTYTTDEAASCTSLLRIYDADIEGVAGSACAGAVLTITMN